MQFNRRRPVYEQLLYQYKEQIANGSLLPGSEIPSRRAAAILHRMNPNTAQRAYREMEELGMITTFGNSPSRVTEDKRKIAALRTELVQVSLDEFIHRAKRLLISREEVLTLVNQTFEEDITYD